MVDNDPDLWPRLLIPAPAGSREGKGPQIPKVSAGLPDGTVGASDLTPLQALGRNIGIVITKYNAQATLFYTRAVAYVLI